MVETLVKSSPDVKPENQNAKFDLADDVATGQLLLEVDLKDQEKEKAEAEKPTAAAPEPTPKVDVKEEPKAEPDWIPEKFKGKSKEEIALAYVNLEKMIDKKAEEKAANLKKSKAEEKEPEETPVDQDKFYHDLLEKPLETLEPIIAARISKALDSDVISRKVEEVIASKHQEIQKANKHISEMQQRHPDFETLRPKICEVMKQLPESLWDDEKSDPMEIAYKIAKGESIEQASAKAQQLAQKDEQDKTKVFSESSGAGGGILKPKASVDDDIRNSIVSAGKKNLLYSD